MLCNEFEYMMKNQIASYMILEPITECLNFIFSKKAIIESHRIPELLLNSFSHILKTYEEYEYNSAANRTITNCLDFLTLMCKHDISFVYKQRDDLFDYLDKMNDKLSSSLKEDSGDLQDMINYARAGLNLIENLIKYWNYFEIYVLLDRDGINAFINQCKQFDYEDEDEQEQDSHKIILMANNISNEMFNYKAKQV